MKKKSILLFGTVAFCLMLSTATYSSLNDILVKYCVPKPGNDCNPNSKKATFIDGSSGGCSCPVGREYTESSRSCELCSEKDGGNKGYYKSNAGVGKCSQIQCSNSNGSTYLAVVSGCNSVNGNTYLQVLQVMN